MGLLSFSRRLAQGWGLEVNRANAMTTWRCRLPALLQQMDIGLVLDVGSNDGGFASELLGNGYSGRILSFEPLPRVWQSVHAKAQSIGDGRWEVADRVALSDSKGVVAFNEAGNSVSSSILPMLSEHEEAAPGSTTVAKVEVPTDTLDRVLEARGLMDSPAHLKLDVQGAEHLVLAGATGALEGPIRSLQVEMSTVTLYEGQMLYPELDAWLRECGFELWDAIPGFRDSRTLRMLQFDGFYVRKSA